MSSEPASIVIHGGERKLECPNCQRLLPVDAAGECDRCGTHFELVIRT